jgi:hypothetical protein
MTDIAPCSGQLDLFPARLKPTQQAVMAALGRIVGAADTHDIEAMLAAYDSPRQQRNEISKRLGELEDIGLVVRSGHNYERRGNPTTWRLT